MPSRHYASRYGAQENDHVQASSERDSHFGSYQDGDHIPGPCNSDGTPDMRNQANREAFLGEKTEDRSFQRASNIVRGAIRRGNDPQEIMEVAQQEPVGSRNRGGYEPERGNRSRDHDSRDDRGVRTGGNDDEFDDICGLFEERHRQEIALLNDLHGELGRKNCDWNHLDKVCEDACKANQEEYETLKKLKEMVPDEIASKCDEVMKINGSEHQKLKDLTEACKKGSFEDCRHIAGDLEDIGAKEGECFNEIEEHLTSQRDPSPRGEGRGGSSSRRPESSNRDGVRGQQDLRNTSQH